MARDEDTVGGGIPESVRRDLHEVWTVVDAQKPDVDAAVKRKFAALVVGYYRAIRPFRNEQALQDHEWDGEDIHWLREKLNERQSVEKPAPGRGGGSNYETVPAIDLVAVGDIESVADDLDDMAKELGFTETAREQTPTSEVTHEDLRGLVELRGQEQAAENLPPAEQGAGD